MPDIPSPSFSFPTSMEKVPRKNKLIFIIGVILIAIVIGFVSHYLGRGIGWFGGNLLATKPQSDLTGGAQGVRAVLVVLTLGIFMGYAQLIGGVTGNISWKIANRLNIFDVKLAKKIDLISSITIYSIHLILGYISTGMFRELTQILSIRYNLTTTPWWLYVWMIMEYSMLYKITTYVSSDRVNEKVLKNYADTFTFGDLSQSQIENIFGIQPGILDHSQPTQKSAGSDNAVTKNNNK